MDKAALSGKPSQTSAPMGDDIPQAIRDTPEVGPESAFSPGWLMGVVVGVGAIAMAAGFWFASQTQRPSLTAVPEPSQTDTQSQEQAIASTPGAPTQPATAPTPSADGRLLNHYPYKVAPPESLEPIAADGSIKMRKVAAEAFKAMQAAAQAEGVSLVPISGFRTKEDQEHLFFDVKAERGQLATKRAEVSAPPGYSEHHTGYALDVGDGNVPATDLSVDFEKTAAFKWLEANAAYFSFEISFPKDNPQGVSYEPWHWRYVGDIDSLETFYKARTPETTQ